MTFGQRISFHLSMFNSCSRQSEGMGWRVTGGELHHAGAWSCEKIENSILLDLRKARGAKFFIEFSMFCFIDNLSGFNFVVMFR